MLGGLFFAFLFHILSDVRNSTPKLSIIFIKASYYIMFYPVFEDFLEKSIRIAVISGVVALFVIQGCSTICNNKISLFTLEKANVERSYNVYVY